MKSKMIILTGDHIVRSQNEYTSETWRGYTTRANRKRAIAALFKSSNGYWNYFCSFRDTQSEFALHFAHVSWVRPGSIYVSSYGSPQ